MSFQDEQGGQWGAVGGGGGGREGCVLSRGAGGKPREHKRFRASVLIWAERPQGQEAVLRKDRRLLGCEISYFSLPNNLPR